MTGCAKVQLCLHQFSPLAVFPSIKGGIYSLFSVIRKTYFIRNSKAYCKEFSLLRAKVTVKSETLALFLWAKQEFLCKNF